MEASEITKQMSAQEIKVLALKGSAPRCPSEEGSVGSPSPFSAAVTRLAAPSRPPGPASGIFHPPPDRELTTQRTLVRSFDSLISRKKAVGSFPTFPASTAGLLLTSARLPRWCSAEPDRSAPARCSSDRSRDCWPNRLPWPGPAG